MEHYIVHTDGGSRGNPGHAAVGIVIEKKGWNGKVHHIESLGEYIGIATNNVAEYSAVMIALKHLIAIHALHTQEEASYVFYLDSLLVVQQLNGIYKIKDLTLKKIVFEIQALMEDLGGTVQFIAVRRELNSDADFQVNAALDARISS